MGSLNSDYLSSAELYALGFASIGTGTLVHRTTVIPRCENLHVGDHVRIDPFCVLTAASISIGDRVHIGAYSSIAGNAEVEIERLVSLSWGTRIFTSSEGGRDTGLYGPCVPKQFRSTKSAPVRICEMSGFGSGVIILPGVEVGTGSAIAAMSLVAESTRPWTRNGGFPAKYLGDRDRAPVLASRRLMAEAGYLDVDQMFEDA